jgi:hypothetical protein
MGKKPSPRHQLDRKNNDKGYSKRNCRWVLPTVQSRNRSSNLVIRAFGRRMTLIEWCEYSGLEKQTLRRRIVILKWKPEVAISTPPRRQRNNVKKMAMS